VCHLYPLYVYTHPYSYMYIKAVIPADAITQTERPFSSLCVNRHSICTEIKNGKETKFTLQGD